MSNSHKIAHLFGAVLLSTTVIAAHAAQTNTYQPELDTKQQQPHTTDEISNQPKAEGAKHSPYAKKQHNNPASSKQAELQRNQAKCLTLPEHEKDQCLLTLQKKYPAPEQN